MLAGFSRQFSAPAAQGAPHALSVDLVAVANDLFAIPTFVLVVVLQFVAILGAPCVEIGYQPHLGPPICQLMPGLPNGSPVTTPDPSPMWVRQVDSSHLDSSMTRDSLLHSATDPTAGTTG